MAKLSINPKPTFDVAVPIPVHGGDAVPVRFTFRHQTRAEFAAWRESLDGTDDVEILLGVVSAWEFDDELTAENVRRLLDNYVGSAAAISESYIREILQVRAKN